MGNQATIKFGTAKKPGPVINCSDSLSEIYSIVRQRFVDKGNQDFLALVETDGFRIILDSVAMNKKTGQFTVKPSQK